MPADAAIRAAQRQHRMEAVAPIETQFGLAQRHALTAPQPSAVREPKAQYGFTPFARRGSIITNDLIDQLRRDDAY